MESACYRYFSIRTDCYSNTWPTDDVEAYIENSGLFSRLSAGAYHGRNFFCALQIMRVKDWDGWSSNDYDSSSKSIRYDSKNNSTNGNEGR